MTELAKREPAQELSIGSMMQSVIDAGIKPESVDVLERMMALYERTQAKNAEKEFARAFTELQKGMPKVQATRQVPNNDGTTRYKFAPFEEIMRQAQPLLSANGFAVSFNTKWEDSRIVVSCKLLHSGGHSQTNEFAARGGKGPPGSNEGQADMAVKTLAKRGALCDALNIVVEHDTDGDDARVEGSLITAAQAQELAGLLLETKSDMQKFLAFAGAEDLDQIRSARFAEVKEILVRRKAKLKPASENLL